MTEVRKENYKKLSYRDHVRTRSSMYVGSKQDNISNEYIYYDIDNVISLVKEELIYPPALYKIIDEIIVNASDHINRTKDYDGINKCNIIKINFNKDNGEFSIFNNGTGISVEKFEDNDYYIPELLFSKELSGSNFEDTDDKVSGGTNGSGSKITNILSNYFIVETIDAINKKYYYQKFEDGNLIINKPIIKTSKKNSYTQITFQPNYEYFYPDTGYNELLAETLDKLIRTRSIYTSIFCKDYSIYYNDIKLKITKLEQFAKLLIPDKTNIISNKLISTKDKYEWDIVIGVNNLNDSQEQISIINGIIAKSGGIHIKYIQKLILDNLKTKIEKLMKGKTNINTKVILNNLTIFMSGEVVNAEWSSQSKDELKVSMNQFKHYKFADDKIYDKIWKKLKDLLSEIYLNTEQKDLNKTDGSKKRKVKSDNLDDAEWAGTNKSDQCKLFLTEGLSASTYAITGLGKNGRQKYGVLPLRGKVLNVRGQTATKINANTEITELKKVIGLKSGFKYTSLKELRYGGIIVLTDADSVTGDTPLLLKDKNNQLIIKNIEDLSETFNYMENNISGKEYGYNNDYQIWTEKGWTNIKHIMRHKVSKKIYRILTHTGIVDVTEDHSLLNKFGVKITPNECNINDELLHSFPKFEENKIDIPNYLKEYNTRELWDYAKEIKLQYYQSYKKQDLINSLNNYKNNYFMNINTLINSKYDITLDEAWVLGFFMADGSCNIYNWKYTNKPKNRPNEYIFNRISYLWYLSNNNIELLEKSKLILTNIYGDIFNLVEVDKDNKSSFKKNNSKSYRLILNGGKKTSYIIDKYRELLYYKDYKYFHPIILNNTTDFRQNIFNGYYAGDGLHNLNKPLRFDINSKITSQCLFTLCKSLNYEISINHNYNNKEKVYTFNLTKGTQQDNPFRIKKIWEIDTTDHEYYVYDLETDNHHFQAGVGQLIVHNTDGSHIKSLIINMVHDFWPELIDLGFICSLATPIIKMFNKKKELSFYTISEYEEWCKNNSIKGWDINYYKGLGTSEDKDIKENFKNFENKLITYIKDDKTDESINLGFNKKLADDRKEWLLNYNKNNIITQLQKSITITDVINKELIHFSYYDIQRSIPNLIDGFKPTQRKIIFTGLNYIKDNSIKQKVAQFGARVAEKTDYHHGEASVFGTIIKMAQNYVGSNNCNLLLPKGQFGSRLEGGNDHASERYIFTNLSEITYKLIQKEDNKLLKYLDSEGLSIEPEWYIPVLPIILINGAIGIGTGYSTTILQHKLEDIADYYLKKLNNKKTKKIMPKYRNFDGSIIETSKNKYNITGNYDFNDDNNSIIITELPIGTWTKKYKIFLDSLLFDKSITIKKDLANQCITDYKDKSTKNKIYFELIFKPDDYIDIKTKDNDYILKKFNLITSLSETNMYLFDRDNLIKKYNSIYEILDYFYEIRLEYYIKRKELLLNDLEIDKLVLQNKVRFIKNIINNTIKIMNIKKDKLYLQLENMEFYKYKDNYDYLINMQISTLTYERVIKLENEYNIKENEFNELKNTEIKDIWIRDINEVLVENTKYNNELLNEKNN
jgi:DNA gyrase/topoisomerase IV subunit B